MFRIVLILITFTLCSVACTEIIEQEVDFDAYAVNQQQEDVQFESEQVSQSEAEIPPVDIECFVSPDQNSCQGSETILSINCTMLYEGEQQRSFEQLLVNFADDLDREVCKFTSVMHLNGIKSELQPGDEVLVTNVQTKCTQMPWDNKIDLNFSIFDQQWYEDVDTDSIKVRYHYFSDCVDDHLIEGWNCDPEVGYPVWISSPGAMVQVVNSGPFNDDQDQLPDYGWTFNFACEELPAAILIDGGAEVEVLPYGYNLPEFSVWLDFQEALELTPEAQQTFNSSQLHLNEVQGKTLLRLPALHEDI